jgi:hypothetical protein
MDDVSAPQFANEQRPVPQLSHDRPDELHRQQTIDRPGRQRIDRHEPRLDVRVLPPAVEHPLSLDGVPAENPQRRGDDRDPQTTMYC